MPVPITRLNFQAIWPGHLYLGPAPWGRDVPALRRAGVNAVLSVLDGGAPYRAPLRLRRGLAWASIQVEAGVPSVEQLTEGIEQLRRWRRDGRVVYVHCLAGGGLGAVVAMAYVWAEGRSHLTRRGLGSAIAEVVAARPVADPSPAQLRALCEFAITADVA